MTGWEYFNLIKSDYTKQSAWLCLKKDQQEEIIKLYQISIRSLDTFESNENLYFKISEFLGVVPQKWHAEQMLNEMAQLTRDNNGELIDSIKKHIESFHVIRYAASQILAEREKQKGISTV